MPIKYVPEAMNVQSLMYNFIKQETTIACVVDEFGGTAGLITLEDILEEIFGEIEDEHDIEDNLERKISKDEYVFAGRLEIDYLNEKYENLNIPEGEYHTLSGYIVMTSGSIPKENAKIQMDGFDFILEEVSETKIEVVRVIKLFKIEEEDKI
jgi:CBS domain containing-hemolysin-like protein